MEEGFKVFSRRDFMKGAALLGATVSLSLMGCSITSSKGTAGDTSEISAETAGSSTHTIIDGTGAEVVVPVDPQRIAISPVPVFSMVYAMIGSTDSIVSINKSAYTGYKNSIMKEISPESEGINHDVFGGDTVNIESLRSLDPDLVILFKSQDKLAQQIKAAGMTVVMLGYATDLESLETLITMMGEILNCPDRVQMFLDWYHDVESRVAAKSGAVAKLSAADKPKVLHFYTVDDFKVYNIGANANMTTDEGGTNIDTGTTDEIPAVTMETLLTYDPDIIFISNFDDYVPDDFYNNTIPAQDWSNVSAVKKRQVYKVPLGLYRWAPPNSIEKPLYYMWTAQHVQPSIFGSYFDMDKETRYFFKTFLDYDLDDAQVSSILHKEMNGEK